MTSRKIKFQSSRKDEEDGTVVAEDLTVKFQITDTQIIAHSYNRNLQLADIKRDIANKFKIDDCLMKFQQFEDWIVDEEAVLDSLTKNQFGIVELRIVLTKTAIDEKVTLDLNVYYSHFTLPEIITVDVDQGDGVEQKILVEIENRTIIKPFIGGYRNPVTRVEYHNANTQTGPQRRNEKQLISRDTQTDAYLMQSMKTTRTCQNEVRRFVSSDEMLQHLQRTKMAIRIQRCYKAYRWRQLIRNSAEKWRILQQKTREKNDYETTNAEYNKVLRLLHLEPQKKDDFDRIYSSIQQWKRSETVRLKEMLSEAPFIAELNALLEREVFLLGEVDRRRNIVRRANQEKVTDTEMIRLGKPTKFISKHNGQLLSIDTVRTQKIRKWVDFYSQLKTNVKGKKERLELLDKVMGCLRLEEIDLKETSPLVNYPQIRDLQILFDRERNMFELNFNVKDMVSMRERQLLILFEFIQAINLIQKHQHKEETRLCSKCQRSLPSNGFILLGRTAGQVDICKRCNHLKEQSIRSSKHNVYRAILGSIRRDERRRGALASYAFIIQEDDIRFLIENIWNGHSILSQNSNRHQLRLPRWTYYEDWAPWNCVCLTETEAKAHTKLRDLESVYETLLLDIVKGRNNLAMTAFRKLKSIDTEFVESGSWWSIGLNGNTSNKDETDIVDHK